MRARIRGPIIPIPPSYCLALLPISHRPLIRRIFGAGQDADGLEHQRVRLAMHHVCDAGSVPGSCRPDA